MVLCTAREFKSPALGIFPAQEDSIPPDSHRTNTEVAEITETLRLLFEPDQEFELRALRPAEYRRFRGDRLAEATEWAAEQSAKSKNVYMTLNPLTGSSEWEGQAARDQDVLIRRRLLIDIDPVRPGDVSATDEEKEQAHKIALAIRDWLREQGFPEPILADSGNGWHLLYCIELPAADQGLVKRTLRALAAKFNTPTVTIDTTVSNPSRITKLYGTVARKGPDEPDRPHRKSAIVDVPPYLKPVPVEAIQAVAALALAPADEPQAASGPRLRRPVPVPDLPREEAIRRAEAYVAKMPPAVSGQGGHNQTFAVACCLVRDFGLSVTEARPVLQVYNQRCEPPWEPWELDHKLDDADDFEGPRGLFLVEFSNYRKKKGLSCPVIAENLFNITGGWPKVAGSQPFVPGPNYRPTWLADSKALFAWVFRQLAATRQNPVRWADGTDKVTKAEFHTYLAQNADAYDAVEACPHHPPLAGHFYLHPLVAGGDGTALAALLARFNPATEADRQLVKAMLLTPFWGGPGGTRPAFLITSEEEDESKGRGAGKTSLAEMAGLVAGGVVSFSKEEKPEVITTRLLSPSALDKRVVLFDNVKTLKFSSEVLEGLLTAAVVSGRKLYHGEGSRPNTLTYIMTINGASLSKDMAQRCVIVKVRRPVAYSGDWAEATRRFIDENRWALIGDILAELRREVAPPAGHSRWGQWERDVLARCGDVVECQRVVAERQGEVDGDQDEADLVRDTFAKDLKLRGFEPATAHVWYTAEATADLVNHATGEFRPRHKATGYLNTLAIKEIRHQKGAGSARGYAWKGSKARPDAPRVRYDSTGKRGLV
jgi:hypothetical protein